jgi:putative ABC transport system permease protein
MLVGGEIALALTLLVGAGLLVRSFVSLTNVDRGFSTTGVVNVTLQAWGYYPTGAHRVEYVREAIRRLQSLPGIEQAAMTSSLPLSARIGQDRTTMVVEGQDVALEQDRPTVHVSAIAGDYTRVLGIRVVSGRTFNDDDRAGSVPVTIVNEAFVRRFFPATNPLGKRVTFSFQGAPQSRTIVGVIGDMRHEGLQAEAAPGAFVPHAQGPTGAVQLVALTTLGVADAQRLIRAELASTNGAMPLSEITSLDARLSDSLRERRFHLGLLAAFSATALFLATIGVYGMMSQATSERTREIGVRVALGAQSRDVVLMVLRHGILVTAAGLGVGCIIAVTSTRLMRAMLFQVEPLDAMTYAGALLLITIVASLAAFLPARRAATIDPIRVLRNE